MPFAAPTDAGDGAPSIGASGTQITLPGIATLRATPYRYRTLIERAKQLAALAQQMEGSFLSVLEKGDAAQLDLVRARQQAELARGSIRLQDLRVQEAQHGVQLAERQKARATIHAEHFAELLREGPLDEEEQALGLLWILAGVQFGVAAARNLALQAGGVALDVASGGLSAGSASGAATIAGMALDPTIFSGVTGGLASWSSALSMSASFERSRQDWVFQSNLARMDEMIGDAQILLAGDRVGIVGQERAIALLQADHADDIVAFLGTRFTGVELYDWISGVLEGVYRYSLQQATAVARLAEAQLAFERQEAPPAVVLADYWNAPRDAFATSPDTAAPDRRGMTGSARLLQDITRLDQYAFDTDRRKDALTKTISLARLDPFAFQRFRETGVMIFATPAEIFDRDIPGQYLRLIRSVHTSVVALIPPSQGIKATLSTTGISRVTIGGDRFQTTVVHRPPESMTLTAAQSGSGVIGLEPQGQGEMLLPFEGLGVDTTWEFRMPRPANPIDYRAIADVLVTIVYTALNSPDYRLEVVENLDPRVGGDRPFSLRKQFADQWYDLNHPDLTSAAPTEVRLRTDRGDFPANLSELAIKNVVLYFVRRAGVRFEMPVDGLYFTDAQSTGAVGGPALSVNASIDTRHSNAASWTSMIGKSPIGTWQLAFPKTDEVVGRFERGELEDILLVISYEGQLPAWPE